MRDCDAFVHAGYSWERFCFDHLEIGDCSRCRLLPASEIGGLCGNCQFADLTAGSKGSLGEPYFSERGWRETDMTAPEIVSLSLGGGWQSTALALLLENEELPGYRRPDIAVFADTKAEPPWVYETVEKLESILSYPVATASFGNLEEDTWKAIRGEPTRKHPNPLPEEDGKPSRGWVDIPLHSPQGLFKRHCTQDYKSETIKWEIRRRFGWPIRLVQYIGISSDESYRMKDAREKYITNVYPLAMSGWDRSRCMQYMARRWPDVPVNRSACYFCPFHSPGEWMHIVENAPDLFEKACRMDEALRVMPSGPYGLTAGGPLRERMAAMRMQGRLDLDGGNAHGDECEGHCFV